MKKTLLIIGFIVISISAHADPIKIMKSDVKSTFASDVTSYASELAEWKAHMARVASDKAAGVPKERAFAPYPAPVSDPNVMRAVDADGNPNYQIIDDSPTPDQILENKKVDLITKVRMAEQNAVTRIVPRGKRRAFDFRQNDITAADEVRATALLQAQPGPTSIVSEWLAKVGIGPHKDQGKAEADSVAQRPPQDTQFLADQATRQAKIRAIEHAAAQMESDIEDLTTSNIDSWSMPAFPN